MDGAQFAKMLSDKHLFELNRMEYKYSTVSVKEFAELLRQNFAQPLPLTDFSGNKLFYLPNLAQISTNGIQKTEKNHLRCLVGKLTGYFLPKFGCIEH